MFINLDRFKNKIAVVTGASAGIGAGILEKLILEDVNVVGLARRVERIEELAKKLNKLNKGQIYGIKCDMSSKEDIIKAFKWIENNLGSIHILINNAGILKDQTLIEGDYEIWKHVFDTNVLGLCLATQETIKSMKKYNVTGHIVNINSICGQQFHKFERLNVYSASKFAARALAETFQLELMQTNLNIKITTIHPGAVQTEFGNHESIKNLLESMARLSVENIADTVIYVLSTPPEVQIKELTIKPMGEIF